MTTIAALSDALLATILTGDPIDATLLGIPGYDRLLADESEAATQAQIEAFTDLVTRLDAVEAATDAEALEVAILREFTQGLLEWHSARMLDFTISDYFGATLGGLLTTFPLIVLATPENATDHLERLQAVPGFLAVAAGRATAGTAAGRTAVAHLVQQCAAQVDRYLGDPEHDPFLVPAPPDDWSGAAEFEAQRRQIVADAIRPAITAYRDTILATVLPYARSPQQPGLHWLPDGDATYAALVRYHTTTALTPLEIHQLGLTVIADLEAEYAEIGGRLFATRVPSEIFQRIRTDPALRYRDEAEILALAESAIRRAEALAPAWFGKLPRRHCLVQAVPADLAEQSPGAYYYAPALDGSRPGIYFANTFEPENRHRHESEAIAFHEAVPGHHLQLSLIQELSLSPLRQIYTSTAYAEGWGLYAERLADEMGLYSDDVGRLGMLSADSMRAARLVVDTGMHALGWSRDQAVAFCREHTPMAPSDIEVEIDRYISDPGQALAYMTGRLEIQRVRTMAQERLGGLFDIRGFHDAVLGVGGVPLGLLEGVVMTWCESVEAQDS